MKKILLIVALGSSLLFANFLTDMAKKKVADDSKDKVRKVIVKSSGNKVIGNKIADKIVGKKKKKNPIEKLKSDLVGKALGI
ncbi:MAG: hypothetical protein QM493_09015 [Sulfurovum sp.]